MEQKRIRRSKSKDKSATQEEEENGPSTTTTTTADATTEELKEDTDAFLDEIDSLLEQNAEEFVKAYVQKGGQ